MYCNCIVIMIAQVNIVNIIIPFFIRVNRQVSLDFYQLKPCKMSLATYLITSITQLIIRHQRLYIKKKKTCNLNTLDIRYITKQHQYYPSAIYKLKEHLQQFSHLLISKEIPPECRAGVLVKACNKICPLSLQNSSISQLPGKRLTLIYYAFISTRQIWTANWLETNEHF